MKRDKNSCSPSLWRSLSLPSDHRESPRRWANWLRLLFYITKGFTATLVYSIISFLSSQTPLPRDALSHLHPIQWHAIPQLCSCAVNSLAQLLQWENNKKEIIFRMESSSPVHPATTQAALSAQLVHLLSGAGWSSRGRKHWFRVVITS